MPEISKMEFEIVNIEDVKDNPANARIHPETRSEFLRLIKQN